MTITELIDHLTIVAKKNPNLIVYSCVPTEDIKLCKIDSGFFKIGHVKKIKYFDDDIDECEPEEASDFLIQ